MEYVIALLTFCTVASFFKMLGLLVVLSGKRDVSGELQTGCIISGLVAAGLVFSLLVHFG